MSLYNQQHMVWPVAVDSFLATLCERAPFLKEALPQAIRLLTEDLVKSGQLVNAWRSSLLAYNRAPIEFTTSTLRKEALFCTIDPFVKTPARALDILNFQKYYKKVGEINDTTLFDKVRQSQIPEALRFGSWLGLKYEPGGTKVKVYSEIQNTPEAFAPFFANPGVYHKELKERGLKLLMIGYYPNDSEQTVEQYYQWHSAKITETDIKKIMAFFGCETLFPALISVVKQALELTPAAPGFPQTTYGFSITYQSNFEPETFSLFTMTPSFFGHNSRASSVIVELMDDYQWDMPLFRSLLAAKLDVQHNVIGFSVAANGMTGMNCAFSPANDSFREINVSVPQKKPKPRAIETILQDYQLANGAFSAQVMIPGNHWQQDGNAFVTAQVLRLLDYDQITQPFIDKALDFLISCETESHHYSFWPPEQHPKWMGTEQLPPDVDDTAVITEVLYKYGRIDLETVKQTAAAMSACYVNRVDTNKNPWAECYTYHTWMNNDKDLRYLDCCVNTNALILLAIAERRNTPAFHSIIRMLKNAVRWSANNYDRLRSLTPYYAHPHEWIDAMDYARKYDIFELESILQTLKTTWGVSQSGEPSPLYCRHDGHFLWFSSCLSEIRQSVLIHTQKEIA